MPPETTRAIEIGAPPADVFTWLAEQQMASAMERVASYDSTADPQVQDAWAKKVDAELEKLKELVEVVERDR